MSRSSLDVAVALGSAMSAVAAATVIYNARRVPGPPLDPPAVTETVSVLLPARNEAHRIGPCLRSLLVQRGVPDLEILILDDQSTDGTSALIHEIAGDDPRVQILAGKPLPDGWRGKPHACAQLAAAARGAVLIFVDADTEFSPDAMAASVALLRSTGRDMLSPFPRQVMVSLPERLYQPLVQWTWMTVMPVHKGTPNDPPPTLVANGQFLLFDAAAYRRAGGHAAVRDRTAEDYAMLYAVLGSGGTAAAVDGSRIASCRMYSGWADLVEGYTKWLYLSVDTPRKLGFALGALSLAYVLPPAAALRGSKVGLAGYLAAVAGRVAVARRFGEPPLPSALAHPAASLISGAMIAESWRRSRNSSLTWKGRAV